MSSITLTIKDFLRSYKSLDEYTFALVRLNRNTHERHCILIDDMTPAMIDTLKTYGNTDTLRTVHVLNNFICDGVNVMDTISSHPRDSEMFMKNHHSLFNVRDPCTMNYIFTLLLESGIILDSKQAKEYIPSANVLFYECMGAYYPSADLALHAIQHKEWHTLSLFGSDNQHYIESATQVFASEHHNYTIIERVLNCPYIDGPSRKLLSKTCDGAL